MFYCKDLHIDKHRETVSVCCVDLHTLIFDFSGKFEKFTLSDFIDQKTVLLFYKQTAVQVRVHFEYLLAENYALQAHMYRSKKKNVYSHRQK